MSHRRTSYHLSQVPRYVFSSALLIALIVFFIIYIPPTSLVVLIGVALLVGGTVYFLFTPWVSQLARILMFMGISGVLILRFTQLMTITNLILLVCIVIGTAILLRQK